MCIFWKLPYSLCSWPYFSCRRAISGRRCGANKLAHYGKLSLCATAYVSHNEPSVLLNVRITVHDKFYKGKSRPEWSEDLTPADDDEEQSSSEVKLGKRYSSETTMTINSLDERLILYDLIIRLMQKICFEDASYVSYSSAILIFMPGLAEIRRMMDILSEHPLFGKEDDFRVYPLHSTLSSESQSAVFDVPPLGVRKIVICMLAC